MVILCSPHNPGGRVWTRDELQGVADFARRHDLILVSDEIHHDLVYPGHIHLPMARAAPGITDRLVMMTATTKTFNMAGLHTRQRDHRRCRDCAPTSPRDEWRSGFASNSFGVEHGHRRLFPRRRRLGG